MKLVKNQSAQGDLYFQRVSSTPKGWKVKKDTVVAYGEATGHTHTMLGRGVRVLERPITLDRFVEIPAVGTIKHQEHKPQRFTKGTYRAIRQRTYAGNQRSRAVLD